MSSRAIISKTCLLPGVSVKETFGDTALPRSILSAMARSWKDEFVQLPMHTWATGVPSRSRTFTT